MAPDVVALNEEIRRDVSHVVDCGKLREQVGHRLARLCGAGLLVEDIGGKCRVHVPVEAEDGNLGMDFPSGFHDDAECASTSASDGPKELWVGNLIGNLEFTIGSDNLGLEPLVGSQTILCRHRTVATILAPTSSSSHSGYFHPLEFAFKGGTDQERLLPLTMSTTN